MPKTVFLPIECVSDYTSNDGVRHYIGVASVADMPDLPIDANLREPNTSSKTFQQIYETLAKKPEEFISSNLGLRITAEDVICEYASGIVIGLYVKFLKGRQGVLNGSHTIRAIQIAKQEGLNLENAKVPFLIEVGLPENKTTEICVSLNAGSKVDRRSMLNKAGVYNQLQSYLQADGFKNVSFYQHQSGVTSFDRRCHITHVVDLLMCLDNNKYDYGKGIHPASLIKGGGGNLAKYTLRAQNLYSSLFLGAFEIEKKICELVKTSSFHQGFHKIPGVKESKTIKQHSYLIDGTSYPVEIPSNLALPVVSAFRVFVDNDNWVMPFNSFSTDLIDLLWKNYKEILTKEFRKGSRSINPIISQTWIWESLCRDSLRFYTQLLKKSA